jgi:hypothetical protein
MANYARERYEEEQDVSRGSLAPQLHGVSGAVKQEASGEHPQETRPQDAGIYREHLKLSYPTRT